MDIPFSGLSQVRCDMTTQPAGWIVFQRRVNASVDFYLSWNYYRQGFGDLNGNFWLGLDKLHQLAAPGKGAKLRVDLKHMDFPGQIKYAEYSLFEISNEADGYRLAIGGYSGTAGDALIYHSNMKFSTKDRDHDLRKNVNCAYTYQGAWWFNECYHSNLNGIYPPDNEQRETYITWQMLGNTYGRVTFSEMKVRYSSW